MITSLLLTTRVVGASSGMYDNGLYGYGGWSALESMVSERVDSQKNDHVHTSVGYEILHNIWAPIDANTTEGSIISVKVAECLRFFILLSINEMHWSLNSLIWILYNMHKTLLLHSCPSSRIIDWLSLLPLSVDALLYPSPLSPWISQSPNC